MDDIILKAWLARAWVTEYGKRRRESHWFLSFDDYNKWFRKITRYSGYSIEKPVLYEFTSKGSIYEQFPELSIDDIAGLENVVANSEGGAL